MPDEAETIPRVYVIPAKRHRNRKRVALYCRVSTTMERQLGSLSAQVDFQEENMMEIRYWASGIHHTGHANPYRQGKPLGQQEKNPCNNVL